MKRTRLPKGIIKTKLKNSYRTQLTVLSIFLSSLLFIFFGSMITEPISALDNEIDVTNENVIEIVSVDESIPSTSNFANARPSSNEIEAVYNKLHKTLEVQFNGPMKLETELKIYDSLGLLVANDFVEEGVTGITYKVHEMNPGVYNIKVINDKAIQFTQLNIDSN